MLALVFKKRFSSRVFLIKIIQLGEHKSIICFYDSGLLGMTSLSVRKSAGCDLIGRSANRKKCRQVLQRFFGD